MGEVATGLHNVHVFGAHLFGGRGGPFALEGEPSGAPIPAFPPPPRTGALATRPTR